VDERELERESQLVDAARAERFAWYATAMRRACRVLTRFVGPPSSRLLGELGADG